jgi:thiamine biosynthesis lipoprotein
MPGEPVVLHESRALAGTVFSIDTISMDAAIARQAIDNAFAEVARLESVVSEWQSDSEISIINTAPRQTAVSISPELYGVINRALWFAQLTEGAFDPSFAGCAQLWSIPQKRIPGTPELTECRQRTGYRNILLDVHSSTIKLGLPGMRIGLGGIGKGYRVDRAAEILEAHGINSYVVNGGGDIRVSAGDFHEPWSIDIAHPREPGQRLGSIMLSRGAIATSGDSSWFFDDGGIRYHHIFDPRTGEPARQSIAVTVIAERAIDADALATGLFVLGPERGLALLGDMPGYEALLVSPDNAIYNSPGFPPLTHSTAGDF